MAKLLHLVILVLLVSLFDGTRSAQRKNVLAVFPSVWKSHYLFGRRLLQELAAQPGYMVTLIRSEFEIEEPAIPKVREIRIAGLQEKWLDMGLSFDVEVVHTRSIIERVTRLVYAGTANVDVLMTDMQVRDLLLSNSHFDLLIVDLFLSDALLGLAHYYSIPTVVLSPIGANSWLHQLLGNPQNLALDPSEFLSYTEHMDVWDRCINTLMGIFEKLTYTFFHMISQEAVYRKHFQVFSMLSNISLPHSHELTKNISMVLMNSHPILHYPRAYLPNMLPVAGLHLLPETDLKLPKHLKEFIEGAPQGVIYMSLGANMNIANLEREKLDVLLDVFRFLHKMRVLLRWEQMEFPAMLPPNMMISSWYPQQAILAHKNVKVFVSTCGLMSTVEAINGQTPILAIPVLPRQEVLAQRLVSQEVALIVPFDAIAYDSILLAVKQLTFNNTFKQNMQRLHYILNAEYSEAPRLRACRYIDLILQTAGGNFLKSHATNLNFFQSKLLDVIGIIALGLMLIIAVPFFVICFALRKAYDTHVADVVSASCTISQMTKSSMSVRRTDSATTGTYRKDSGTSATSSSSAAESSVHDSPIKPPGQPKRALLARFSTLVRCDSN